MRLSKLNRLYFPNVLSIILDSSVRRELAGIGNVEPAFLSESKLVLVVSVDFELSLNIAFKVAQNVIMVRNVPACTVSESLVKLLKAALFV